MKTNFWNYVSKAVQGTAMLCAAAIMAGSAVSCNSSLESDLASLEDKVNSLESKITAMEKALSDQVAALEKFAKENITINKMTLDSEAGIYTILLSDNTTIEVPADWDASVPFGIAKDEKGASYWTLNGEPLTTPDGEKVYSAPAIRVNPSTGFWEMSSDGGVTYVSTGIKAGENASLFQKVEEDDVYVYFTLADGSSLKVAKTVDFQISLLAGKQFFQAGETRVVKLLTSGVKKQAVYSKPAGWKAVISGDELNITAPASENTSAETEGSVIVQAWFNDGTSDISEVFVNIGTAPHEINVKSVDNIIITIDPALVDNYSLSGTYVGISPFSGFSEEKLISEIKENTRLELHWPDAFPMTFALKDKLGAEPVKGESYVVWAVDYWDDYKRYDVYYSVITINDLKIEATDITFEDAVVKITPTGFSKYYSGVVKKNDFDAEYILEGINYYAEGVLIDGAYNGLLSKLAPPAYSSSNNILSGETYTVFVVPYEKGKVYTDKDMITVDVDIKKIQVGGNAVASVGEVTSTMTSVSAKITKDAGTYKYWAKYFSDEEIQKFLLDEQMLDELSKNKPLSDNEYVLTQSNLVAGAKGWIVTMAIDKNGFAGKVTKVAANTSELTYSDKELPKPEVTVNYDGALIKIPAIEGIVKYKYLDVSEKDWNNSFIWKGNEDVTEKLIAMAKEGSSIYYTFADAEADGSISVLLSEKQVMETYYLFIMGVDDKDMCTHLVKIEYKPQIKNFVNKDAATYKGLKIKSMTLGEKSISEYTLKEYNALTGFHSFEVTYEVPENCAKIWTSLKGPNEIIQPDPEDPDAPSEPQYTPPYSEIGIIGTGEILSDWEVIKSEPNEPVSYGFFIHGYSVYVVWQDTDGAFYEYQVFDPATMVKDAATQK